MFKAEIGQGVSTAFATLVAEELELELAQTEVAHADSLPQYKVTSFGAPGLAIHGTGGSYTATEIYTPMREAAAAARMMLVEAAARTWGVPATTCRAEAGAVLHDASRRRLAYGELTVAAAALDVPSAPTLKASKDFRLIGKHTNRVDAPDKVTGKTIFGIDHTMPGMVRAAMIHPPRLRDTVASFDASQATRMPGVVDVIAIASGVAVVAEKYWQARQAAATVRVEWKAGPAAGFEDASLIAALRAHDQHGDAAVARGDADARGGSDEQHLRMSYEFPYLAHAALEPQNATAAYHDGRFEIWASTQNPSMVQAEVADATGVSRDKILVHTLSAGGGFGRRIYPEVVVEAAVIAKRIDRPVHVVWSRESDMTTGRYRPAGVSKVEGSVRRGRLHRLRVHNLVQPVIPAQRAFLRAGLAFGAMANIMIAATRANTVMDAPALEGVIDTPYQIPNFRAEYTPVSSVVEVAFWRSVGHSHNGFIIESAVDELAALAKVDPYEFRRRMLANKPRELRVLDAVAAISDWSTPAKDGFAKGIARHSSFGSEVAEVVEASIVKGRIVVRKVWVVVDCGVAINPDIVKAQVEGGVYFGLSAALHQKITIKDGQPQQTNYDAYPAVRMFEAPEIVVQILDSDAHPSGIGEPGVPPLAPALASALYRGHGIRLRELPMQPALERLREAP